MNVSVGNATTAARHRWLGGPKLLRILLISDGRNYTSEQQFAPLLRHAALLRRRLGVVIEALDLADGLDRTSAELSTAALIGIKFGFQTPPDVVVAHVRDLAMRIAGSQARLVYFDGDDDLCIQWPDIFPFVDLYVKKHVFADLGDYGRSYRGKSNLTDLVSRETGFSFADNQIPATSPVPAEYLSKLYLGWNIGLDDKVAKLALISPPSASGKDIDIACRAFVPESTWIHPLRAPLVRHISSMGDRYRVLAPSERVSQQQYYEEMRRARICVSPFGYGELCWRDFEAVLCGCLLVKPDMGHLRTVPDLFVPGETYAPVRWDYSDLEVVCSRYLDDEPLRMRVATRARDVMMEALRGDALIGAFAELLQRIGAGPRATQSFEVQSLDSDSISR